MSRTTLLSTLFAVLGLGLFAWLSYDATLVAASLGLDATLGEAGVAALALGLSTVLMSAAVALPLRQWLARRHIATYQGHSAQST